MPATPPLNLTHVWDFATQLYTTVVEVELDPDAITGMYYKLDSNIPLSPEYPTRWRHRGEIGNNWKEEAGLIFHPGDEFLTTCGLICLEEEENS